MEVVYFMGIKNFTSGVMYTLFAIAFTLYCFSEIYIAIKTRKNVVDKSKKDNGSFYIIIFGVWFSVVLNFYFIIIRGVVAEPFEYIGVFMMVFGVFIRVHSVNILGKSFSLKVSTGESQEFIRKGLYKFVRHPAYLGSAITMIGLTLSFRNTFNIVVTVLILIISYIYRIRVEEKALVENFGDKYLEYKKETRCIIPKIL